MAKTYPARLNGQVAFQDWFNGVQEDAQHYTSQYSNVRESTFAGGAVGDGVTDDTAAIAAAFTDADATGRAVFLPPGTYLTDPIDWRMQSIIGTHSNQCILKGKPGKDVLLVNKTVGQFYRQQGRLSDFTIFVDNSVDASSSFPNRLGCNDQVVGNAGIASEWIDRQNDPAPPSIIGWNIANVEIRGIATNGVTSTAGGLNNTCGIYEQNNMFSQCKIDNLTIGYNVHGWAQHWSNLNVTFSTNSRDHCYINNMHFIRNAYHARWVNWGLCEVNNLMCHGGGVVGAIELMGKDTVSAGKFHGTQITGMEIAGATTYGLKMDASVENIKFLGCSVAGTAVDTWNASGCEAWGFTYVPTGVPSPLLVVAGHRNFFIFRGIGTNTTDDYKYNRIQDLGVGNQIFAYLLGTSSDKPHRLTAINGDSRFAHLRDNVSGQLGIVNPPFVSGNDLLVTGKDLSLSSGLGTNYTWVADSASDFQTVFRRLGTSGDVVLVNNQVNGVDCFRVGKFLPATKLRVSIKAKAATAGTQTWNLEAPHLTVKGSITSAPIGTAYTIISFEADLTGVADGTTLQMNGGIVGGGGAGPVDIDWILFRPWAADWPVVNQQVSADNGDAAKTLVATVDTEVQRWNTVLTAARAVTLSTTKAYNGARFRIVREATATGAFNLNVGTGPLKALAAASTWCDVQYDGTAWRLVAAGAL